MAQIEFLLGFVQDNCLSPYLVYLVVQFHEHVFFGIVGDHVHWHEASVASGISQEFAVVGGAEKDALPGIYLRSSGIRWSE